MALSNSEVIGWLQTHLSQPWSAATATSHVSPELLEALPDLLSTLDPTFQQGALILLMHLPRKTFMASASALERLVETARKPEASEAARVLGVLLRTFVSDGKLRPDEAVDSMGSEVRDLCAQLLGEARAAALVKLPEAYAYVTVPPAADALAGGEPAAAAQPAHAAQAVDHGLFTLRAGYADPLAKHRAAAQPKLNRAGSIGGLDALGVTKGTAGARQPQRPAAAAAAGVGAGASRPGAGASRPSAGESVGCTPSRMFFLKPAAGKLTLPPPAPSIGEAVKPDEREAAAASSVGAVAASSARQPTTGVARADSKPDSKPHPNARPPPGAAAAVAAAAALRAAAAAPKKRAIVMVSDDGDLAGEAAAAIAAAAARRAAAAALSAAVIAPKKAAAPKKRAIVMVDDRDGVLAGEANNAKAQRKR
ncbi:hypothetical protein T492DRAFT_1027531 [Pavlovales sp. CCMP2436]|nr:hypothetical protein T492DRAFT_1027531 [Pavlovales sp. CCMP2436]